MDVYERLGLSRVINASGRMTALGGSTLSAGVMAAMDDAASTYVDVAELRRRAAQRIAALAGAPAAAITTGAAAGIATMVAAVVAGTDPGRVAALPLADWQPREILLQTGHAVDFGGSVTQMVRIGGGAPRLVGAANAVRAADLRAAFGPTAAAVLFIQSHHAVQKGMLGLAEVLALAHAAALPVLVDAAAEEDAGRYVALGADLVAYSGGKAFGGPTAGFIVGREDLVAACEAQEGGVGRPMKVGKETIAGLLQALEEYQGRDDEAARALWDARVERIRDALADLPELTLTVAADEAGRAIRRLCLGTTAAAPFPLADLVDALRQGRPPIEVRAHHLSEGYVQIDPRPLAEGDAEAIARRVREWVVAGRA